ncbi:MAG: asparagine synthase (glutamine-hydrolyzing) [Acutalibacteraceae bacterium]|nr:asparagine synthase (glutamine-hydrolyzing) [Acutalibacteraceae bacterium]
MCGIAGEINFKDGVKFKDYHGQMLNVLNNRGPDDQNIKKDDFAVLLHTRLAVIDPKNGRQPMSARKDGMDYTICYNGELYGTDEIRNALIKQGVTFETKTDTEVVLKSFITFGADCVKSFNGIYAFAIYCPQKRELFIARDKMGVKPFFYAQRGNSFIFASEIKSLLCHPKIKPEIDKTGISELLFIGPGRTPGCGVFKEVYELKPGHRGFFNVGGLSLERYFSLIDRENTDSKEEIIKKVRFLVTDSIEKQLVSDVPIGTFLSGGLDSSIISSVAARHFKKQGKKLKTFSVTYKDNYKFFKSSKFQPNSDDEFIKIMVDYLDSDHTTVTVDTDEVVDALYSAVDARDLPGMADVDASLLLFCKEIKKQVTVALSGECADEIFGGYPWYRDEKIRSRYGFPWAQSTEYREGFLHPDLKGDIMGADYVNKRYEDTVKATSKLNGLSSTESRMKEMVNLNATWFIQTLLDRKYRMRMFNGLEVRVPFCDYRIAEYLYTVPFEVKDLKGREKGLLRTAMEGYLPESILWRKKSPYPKTHNPAYFEAVKNILKDILNNKNAPLFSLCDYKAVEKLLITERSEPWYGQLMTTPQTVAYMIMLNYWMEKFKVKIV